MPVVNIGTAQKFVSSFEKFTLKHGLSFEKAVAFMSDMTNVMKELGVGYKRISLWYIWVSGPYYQGRLEKTVWLSRR